MKAICIDIGPYEDWPGAETYLTLGKEYEIGGELNRFLNPWLQKTAQLIVIDDLGLERRTLGFRFMKILY